MLNPPTLITLTHAHITRSDDVIITADKCQIKILPILRYALFMALPPNNDCQYFRLYGIMLLQIII